MSKVLWLGDAGCTTGFGRVTHAIGERLVSDYGHDIHVLAVNYQGDHWPTNLKLYVPNKLHQLDIYGQSRFIEMLGTIEPEVVVLLQDPFVAHKFLFRNKWDEQKILLQYRPIVGYYPVDGINNPTVWDVLGKVSRPLLMSEHGRTWQPDAQVVPHAVDTEAFHPASPDRPYTSSGGMKVRSKKEAKRALGYPDDGFLVLRVDRNSRRKDYGASWRALIPVMKRHANVHAHFHCKATGEDGVELPQLFSREPELAPRFATPGDFDTRVGWKNDDLAILYNAADLFISTSWGEGFGLTLAEALACGVPVIAQNVSSIPEVVGPGGVLLEPVGLSTSPQGQDHWLPDVPAFTEAIEHLYAAGGTRRKLGEAGVAHVAKRPSWDDAARDFDAVIRDLAAQLTENGESDADRRDPDPGHGAVQDPHQRPRGGDQVTA